MFITLWNYLRGYVIIEVVGFSLERFINLTVNKKIYIWDILKTPKGVRMKISVKNFKRLKSVISKTRCKVKIVKRCGVPFIMFKHRKRKVFVVGVFIFVFLMYLLSSFLWLIEIEGNERVEKEDIINFLSEKGFKVGAFKNDIDLSSLEKELKENFSDISWLTIQINGTKASVKMTENIPKTEKVDYSKPCDIVAKCDGIITEIYTQKGTPLVKTGDVVSKGDVLVSGELIIKNDETGTEKKYAHSEAFIRAKLWKKVTVKVPFKYDVKKYTGIVKTGYKLKFGTFEPITLFEPELGHKNFDKFTEYTQFKAGENYPLPVILLKNQYKDYVVEKKIYTFDDAKEKAEKLITNKIIDEFDFETDIISKTFSYEKSETELTVTATVCVTENIGEEKEISVQNNIEGSKILNGTGKNAD